MNVVRDMQANDRRRARLTALFALVGLLLCVGAIAPAAFARSGGGSGAPYSAARGPQQSAPPETPTYTPGEPQWANDIQISATSPVTPSAKRDYTASTDPTNPGHVLAGYVDDLVGGSNIDFANSTDAGATWTQGTLEGPWGPLQMQPEGDNNVGFDAHGTAYYAASAITTTARSLFILTSTNGLDWSEPRTVVESDNSQSRAGAYMAIDRRATGTYAGSIYIFWSYLDSVPPYQHGIQMRYSRDGGLTWSTDIQVSDPGHEIAEGATAMVAPDGTVYVAFAQKDDPLVNTPTHLYLDRSTDGGMTWGTDRLVGNGPVVNIGAPDEEGHELVLNGSAACSEIHLNFFPSIAVAPNDPNAVYIAWNDGRWDENFLECDTTGRHSDIAFSRTTDGGATWTDPVRVNDDAVGNRIDQFQPVLAIGPSGLIGATWYDRRYSEDGYYYDLAYSQSTDGGNTWSVNRRVSDVSSNADEVPDFEGVGDLGERRAFVYAADASGTQVALPLWLDTHQRQRVGDVFTDRGVFAECPLQFTDVPSTNTFYPYVRCLSCRGIFSGYSDGTFRPNNNITRGQIAKVVSNAAGYADDVTGRHTYADVPTTDTFYVWIERLAIHQVMNGYNCGGPGEPCDPENRPYFRPYSNATRGQMAKVASIAAGFNETPSGQTFTDVTPDSTFYVWVQRLASRGIMSGYQCGGPGEPCDPQSRPYFRPFNDVTRGQGAKIISNTFFPGCYTPQR